MAAAITNQFIWSSHNQSDKIIKFENCLLEIYKVDVGSIKIISEKIAFLNASIVDEFVLLSKKLVFTLSELNQSLPTHDAILEAPNNHQVLFENTFVRILWGETKSGEIEPAHLHPWKSIMLILKGAEFLIQTSKGQREQGMWPIGVYELPAESEASSYSNIGSSDFENLRFEIKS